ncbi:MAG TPA: hypothetical protein VJP45_07625 [Candidatus Limnocylindria bacterium]|nr:hypothetical protein [Candidatus Limnocylindria bacterium]
MLLREAVEAVPLTAVAHAVTVHFPWGSLLRGALAEDQDAFAAICGLPRAGGSLSLLLSVTARDGRAPLTDRDIARIVRAYRDAGHALVERRAIVRSDVEAARSSWGKRLGVSATRPGLLMRFERASARP